MLNSNELPTNKVHTTLKMFGLISIILPLTALLINEYPSLTGPIVFFTLNLLIQLAELKKINNLKTNIKLFILPSFITVIYCFYLPSLSINQEGYLSLVLFFLNFLILPFSQLWLQNINPFNTPHCLAIKMLQNLMNGFLIGLGFLIPINNIHYIPFSTLGVKPDITILLYILFMSWVFFIFRFMDQRPFLSKYLRNIFSVFLKVCLVVSCCLSIFFAIFTFMFNLLEADDSIGFLFMFTFITILLAQSLWLQPHNKKFGWVNTSLFYLVFFTFLIILFRIIMLMTNNFHYASHLINNLTPKIFLSLVFAITLGFYILSYSCLFIFSMIYDFVSNTNSSYFLSKHKSSKINKQSMDSALKPAKADKKNTTIFEKIILRALRPNLAAFNKQLYYFNSIFLAFFIIANGYALSPFFNFNAILTDMHVTRLLNNHVSVEEFNLSVLKITLGNEGKTQFDNLIEIAKAANYPHVKSLEERWCIYKFGHQSTEPSSEVQEKNTCDDY